MFILIGIALTISVVALLMAARKAPTYDEVTYLEVNAKGELVEKELIF